VNLRDFFEKHLKNVTNSKLLNNLLSDFQPFYLHIQIYVICYCELHSYTCQNSVWRERERERYINVVTESTESQWYIHNPSVSMCVCNREVSEDETDWLPVALWHISTLCTQKGIFLISLKNIKHDMSSFVSPFVIAKPFVCMLEQKRREFCRTSLSCN